MNYNKIGQTGKGPRSIHPGTNNFGTGQMAQLVAVTAEAACRIGPGKYNVKRRSSSCKALPGNNKTTAAAWDPTGSPGKYNGKLLASTAAELSGKTSC